MERPHLGRDHRQRVGDGHGRPVFQLRADPRLRAELDYCVPLGIPHSVFCGRVVDAGDPAWLDTDRGYALAWTNDKRATCSGCGTRADEWDTDEDAYIGDQVHCEGCARIAQEQANIPRGGDGQPRPGVHVFLAPREVYEARHPDGAHVDEHAPPAPEFDDDRPRDGGVPACPPKS